MLSFVGKHLNFYPKDVCSFSVFSIEEELNQQVRLIKYIENKVSNSTSCRQTLAKSVINFQSCYSYFK